MHKTHCTLAIALLAALLSTGCASSGSKSSADSTPKAENKQLSATTIPSASPFAKLHYGMGTKEVSDLIGPPTDYDAHITGKAFNPFYYGSDTHRSTWLYKAQGRLIFNSRARLIEVQYDPEERGYR